MGLIMAKLDLQDFNKQVEAECEATKSENDSPHFLIGTLMGKLSWERWEHQNEVARLQQDLDIARSR